MLANRGAEVHPEHNPVINLLRRLMPITRGYHGKRFFWTEEGRLKATPLLVVLLVVETTDVVFAVDSIPAIFGVTRDPFLVFTSNIFAILGLRALYFVLSGMMDRFHLLNVGLGLVLVFIGAKMLAADFVHVSIQLSLTVVVLLLGGAVAASLLAPQPAGDRRPPTTALRPRRPLEAGMVRREPPFGAVARGRRRGYHPGGFAIPPSPRSTDQPHSQDRTMNVFIPKERPGENRVAATPETVKKLIKDGLSVTVEAGAGEAAHLADAAYRDAGATLGAADAADAAAAWSAADLVLKVGPPSPEEARRLKAGAVRHRPARRRPQPRRRPRPRRPQGERAGHGADPPGQPGAVDGRPVVAGVDRRLQGGAARRRSASAATSRC